MSRIGQVLKFKYGGGSRSGQSRVVYVLEESGLTLKTYDFEKNALRTYTLSRISYLSELTPEIDYRVVNCNVFPKNYDPDQVVEDYEKEGLQAYYHDTRNVIIVLLSNNNVSIKCYGNAKIEIQNNDTKISIDIVKSELSIYVNDVYVQVNSIQDLINLLEQVG